MTELYKRHRPETLDRVVGNEETVVSLANMLKRKTLPHSILFHGPSGCGKTTLARIVAKELGCHQMAFSEVNSASFRGIDTVRDIQSRMNLHPPAGPCRVWLLDEVHKLSNDAQNGALKMLEDTPSHVYFLLCTTDPQKLIKAIQTRCHAMPVRLLTADETTKLCKRVMKREGFQISDKVLEGIPEVCGGSARSALVLLEKLAAVGADQHERVLASGLMDEQEGIEICRAILKRAPWKKIAKMLQASTADPEELRWSVLGYARQVLLTSGDWQAYNVIQSFSSPFYDTKAAGLAAAAYEAVNAKE